MTQESAPPDPPQTASRAVRSAGPLPTGALIWLIDGFNVLHAGFFEDRERTRWWSSEHRTRLLERVEGFREPAEAIWIVFDGPHAALENSDTLRRTLADRPLHAIFAENADDWILKRVKSAKDPESIAVVTGDRSLANKVRHHKANPVPPRRFLDACAPEGSRRPRKEASETPSR